MAQNDKTGTGLHWILGCESSQEESLTDSFFENTAKSPETSSNNSSHIFSNKKNNHEVEKNDNPASCHKASATSSPAISQTLTKSSSRKNSFTHDKKPFSEKPASKATLLLSCILGSKNSIELDRHAFWTCIFQEHFLTDPCLADDLIFYVKMAPLFGSKMKMVVKSFSCFFVCFKNYFSCSTYFIIIFFLVFHLDF